MCNSDRLNCHWYLPQHEIPRLYSERQILARGLAHPIVFMGGSTPRALDGVVDGVVKTNEEQSDQQSTVHTGKGAGNEGDRKGENGMQTFFTKVKQGETCVLFG